MRTLTKKCPRCQQKNLEQAIKCSSCGLIFERLERATNVAAKKVIKQGYKEKVVYVTNTPKDLKRATLIILTIALGIFGAHCFYVGRNTKGIIMLCLGTLSLIMGMLSIMNMITTGLAYLLSFIVGVNALIWLLDCLDVCIFRFKIPVYIDTEVKDENSSSRN